MPGIIGSVSIAPEAPRPWEPVLIEVRGPDGELLGDDTGVTIDGARVARLWTQLPPGPRRIRVRAGTGPAAETQIVEVVVAGEPVLHRLGTGEERPAQLIARPAPEKPYLVTFLLAPHGRPLRRHPRLTSGRKPGRRLQVTPPDEERTYHWTFGDGATAVTSQPHVQHDFTRGFDHRRAAVPYDVTCATSGVGIEPLTLTRTLVIDSWYAMCASRGRIVCPVEDQLLASIVQGTAQGRFVVHNPEDVALTFTRMAIQAMVPEADHDPWVHPGRTLTTSSILERLRKGIQGTATPGSRLQISAREDDPPLRLDLEEAVTVAPRSSAAIAVHPGLDELPDGATGYGITLAGTAEDGRPCRASAHFELDELAARRPWRGARIPVESRHTWPWEEVMRGVEEVIRHPGSQLRIPGLTEVELAAIRVDRQVGMLSVALPPRSARRAGSEAPAWDAGLEVLGPLLDAGLEHAGAVARKGTFDPEAPPEAGKPCNPWNLSDDHVAKADQESLTCLVTGTEERRISGRFPNARKGDVILSPGAGTPMALLYQHMDPPQLHSHALIMTRNFDEVASSFGSADWLEAQLTKFQEAWPLPPIPTPEMQAVRFGWPGAVAQHAEDAIEGEHFEDPDGRSFEIRTLHPYPVGTQLPDASFRVTPAMVLKPDPITETPAQRALLRAAAERARLRCGRVLPDGTTQHSQDHFSFFTFTNGAHSIPALPTGGGWPDGTLPSACSTFIWRELRAAGATFEQTQNDPTVLEVADLEPGDVDPTLGANPVGVVAEVRPGSPDGLYLYTAAERRAAGHALRDSIVHAAAESDWFLGGIKAAGAEVVGNLFLNVIDRDEISFDGDWQETGPGVTVSPDDMFFWDAAGAGPFGAFEPLLYRQPRTEVVDVYTWTKYEKKGRVRGRVTHQDEPFAGATVTCNGREQQSKIDGSFDFPDVPRLDGTFIDAVATIGGRAASSTVTSVDVDADVHVVLPLQIDADARFRRVDLGIHFHGVDDEGDDEDDEEVHKDRSLVVQVGPGGGDESVQVRNKDTNPDELMFKWGHECRAEYKVVVTANPDGNVTVALSGKLFEGTYEDTNELEDSFDDVIIGVKAGQTKARTRPMSNDGTDKATITLTIVNAEDDAG